MINRAIGHLLSNKKFHILWLSTLSLFFVFSIVGIKIGDKEISKGLKVDNSMEVWYSSDDPIIQKYNLFKDMFGSDEFVVVAFKQEEIFKNSVLKKIKEITKKLEAFPYVSKVISITNVEHVSGENDAIFFSQLIPDIPNDQASMDALKFMALQNPMYRKNIISGDGKVTAIVMEIERQKKGINYQRELTDKLYDFFEKESEESSYQFHISGLTVLFGLEDKASTDDAVLEYLLTTLVLIGLLYFIQRRWVYVFISYTVIIVANIMLHGLMPLFGSTYNIITAILASLIMVIGVADTIHFISEYKAQALKTDNPDIAVKRAIKGIFIPCLFTSLTTAVGFASMMVSSTHVIREFAVYAAVGMLITFIVNIVLASVWLGFLDTAKEKERSSEKDNPVIRRFLMGVANINRKHVRLNILIAFIVLFVSLTGIMRVTVNTHELKYFKKDHPIRVATEFIEEHLTGTMAFELVFTGKKDTFKSVDVFNKIEEMQNFLESVEYFKTTFSIVNIIKELHKVIQNNNASFYSIPQDEVLLSDLLFLAEGSDASNQYMDTMDYSAVRIHGRLNYVDNNTLKLIYAKIENKMHEIFKGSGIKPEISGEIPLYINLNDYLIESQIKGFGLALFSIFVMLSLLVRSVKLGLISMFPNIIPVFLTFGIMGLLGINLDMGTVLIASVSIGLAVDDTIHFIARFRNYFERYNQYEKAIEETILSIGSPLLVTSIVLFAGFIVLVVSTFKPIVYFGVLTSITMISALIGDLFVLPALIKVFKPFGPEKITEDVENKNYEYIDGRQAAI